MQGLRIPLPVCLHPSVPRKAQQSGQVKQIQAPSSFQLIIGGGFFLLIRSLLTTSGRGEGRGAALGSCELSAGVGNGQESHRVSLAIVLCFGV